MIQNHLNGNHHAVLEDGSGPEDFYESEDDDPEDFYESEDEDPEGFYQSEGAVGIPLTAYAPTDTDFESSNSSSLLEGIAALEQEQVAHEGVEGPEVKGNDEQVDEEAVFHLADGVSGEANEAAQEEAKPSGSSRQVELESVDDQNKEPEADAALDETQDQSEDDSILTADVQVIPPNQDVSSMAHLQFVTPPPPPESTLTLQQLPWYSTTRCHRLIVGTILLLIVMMGAVAVAVILASKSNSSGASSGTSLDDDKEPRPQPPNGMTLQEYLQAIRQDLFESSTDTLTNSPHVRATEWLTFEDYLFLEPGSWELKQRYALLVVFYALGGQEGFLSGWTKSGAGVHECEWTFVECSASQKVEGLVIVQDNVGGAIALSGILASEIAFLDDLKRLGLANNRLEGPLPAELYNLDLEYLDISNNEFSSTLQSEIGNLKNLAHFHISANAFSGRIPSEMQQLEKLKIFSLEQMALSGPLLEYATKWPRIREIHAMRTLVSGTIPTEIGRLTDLVALDLYDTGINGTFPTEMGELHSLGLFRVAYTPINGPLPEELGSCSSLAFIMLHDNSITGSIPTTFGLLGRAEFINLGANPLQGTIPTELGLLTKLWSLVLRQISGLSGTVPSELGELTDLERVFLEFTELTGSVPSEVCELQNRGFVRIEMDCISEVSCPVGCCTTCH